MPIYRLKNIIQNYEWGSYTAIANFLGDSSSEFLPQAELWIGAHPKAPSSVLTKFGSYSLTELLKNNPIDILGERTFKTFGYEFPYLLKVLAVEKPLSIQVHPNQQQALLGYYKDNYSNNRKKIVNSEKNYLDKKHKLECICALSPLWTLNGFRTIYEIQLLMKMVCPDVIFGFFKKFVQEPNKLGLKKFFSRLIFLSKKEVKLAIFQLLLKASKLRNKSLVFKWVCRLADIYPHDIGVFAPIMLNLVRIDPGQAMFIPSGILHTHMRGMGVELMVNSDNVVRGGLTSKHIDKSEFLKLLNFDSITPCLLDTEIVRSCEERYKTNVPEFELSIINLSKNKIYLAPENRSAEILLCSSGDGFLVDDTNDFEIKITKGDSILVTASVLSYSIYGKGKIFKASVPYK